MEKKKKTNVINMRVSDEFLNYLDELCAINGCTRTMMVECLVYAKYWENASQKERFESIINSIVGGRK